MTIRLVLLAALTCLAVPASADNLSFSNKWRIECSGDAESDGTLQFRVTPRRGEPTLVTVNVENGRSENGVARDIREAFEDALPDSAYDVETDDGEDVLIKKDLTEPAFAIELVSSNVADVRVRLDRE